MSVAKKHDCWYPNDTIFIGWVAIVDSSIPWCHFGLHESHENNDWSWHMPQFLALIWQDHPLKSISIACFWLRFYCKTWFLIMFHPKKIIQLTWNSQFLMVKRLNLLILSWPRGRIIKFMSRLRWLLTSTCACLALFRLSSRWKERRSRGKATQSLGRSAKYCYEHIDILSIWLVVTGTWLIYG